MTVPAAPFRKDHTLTGSIVPLLYDWKVENKTHLLVTLVNTSVTPNVESTLVVDTDYTVNNVGSDTGTITPASAHTAGWKIVITSNVPYEQDTDFTNQNSVKPEEAESMADKLGRQIKQIVEVLSRTVKTTVGGGVQPDDLIDAINDAVTLSGTNAATSTTQAGIATTQAGIATTQAGIATAAVEGIPYRDVVFLTFANSPYTMTNADRGKLFSIDTSGGNFVFNLAQISGLTMPFTVGIKKATNDANTITINRAGTDLIDAATSYVIVTVAGVNLVGDTDGTPDKWTSAAFGAGAGEIKTQTFTGGVDYTAGSTTTLTLTNSPVSPSSAALEVFFDGVAQHPSEWTYNPGTAVITFTSAIPTGVAQVFTRWASSSVSIGTPSDGTVSWAKLASALIASVAEMVSGTASKIVSAANLKTFVDQYQPRKVLSFVPEGGSTDIVIGYTFRAGYNYRIEIDNLQVGTDNTVLKMFMSSDDGVSYVNSASAYTARRIYGTTGVAGDTNTSTVANITGYGMKENNPLCGTLRLFDPNNSGKNPMGLFDYIMIETTGLTAHGNTGIRLNANMACNKIKLSSTTNFSNTGRITVYEEPAT